MFQGCSFQLTQMTVLNRDISLKRISLSKGKGALPTSLERFQCACLFGLAGLEGQDAVLSQWHCTPG